VKTIEELFIELPKIMRVLGSGISKDLLAFNKLIRLLNYAFTQKNLYEEYKDIIKIMIQFSLLPALG